mmetsp:Transcript_27096/g.54174  ORF Transcript_27096/g.54174 Transcript_27096/m.54174 type:complete len:222 (-) Transcript_27096:1267-1932(-)
MRITREAKNRSVARTYALRHNRVERRKEPGGEFLGRYFGVGMAAHNGGVPRWYTGVSPPCCKEYAVDGVAREGQILAPLTDLFLDGVGEVSCFSCVDCGPLLSRTPPRPRVVVAVVVASHARDAVSPRQLCGEPPRSSASAPTPVHVLQRAEEFGTSSVSAARPYWSRPDQTRRGRAPTRPRKKTLTAASKILTAVMQVVTEESVFALRFCPSTLHGCSPS